ncbi:hypothetical protein TURU_085148 [Turdus rufiventris]|nr:hypothetical protein TURU_085148 [Turdus rufiventris]
MLKVEAAGGKTINALNSGTSALLGVKAHGEEYVSSAGYSTRKPFAPIASSPELSRQVLARSQGQPHNLAACAASAKEVESSKEAGGKPSSACQQQDPWDLALEFLWSLNHYIKVSSLAFVCYCLAPLAFLIQEMVYHIFPLKPEGNTVP